MLATTQELAALGLALAASLSFLYLPARLATSLAAFAAATPPSSSSRAVTCARRGARSGHDARGYVREHLGGEEQRILPVLEALQHVDVHGCPWLSQNVSSQMM